jgi:hypothetical protein
MKRLVSIAILAGVLLIPSTALAVEDASAPWVEHQLVTHWSTSDGYTIHSADCLPTNHFTVRAGRVLSNRWNCLEVDSVARVFWVHVHVANSAKGHLASVADYRCSATSSTHSCP